MRLSSRTLLWMAVTASSSLVGCVGADGEQASGVAASAPATAASTVGVSGKSGINGTLLSAIQREDDHRIEFYDFGHGAVAAHESLVIGETAELDAIDQPMSLSDIYRRLEPTRAVPAALVEADARAAQLHAKLAAAAGATVEPSSGGDASPVVERGATVGANGVKSGPSLHTDATCSSDENGDGWSGTWFINSYCNQGSFRFCEQNWGSAYHYDSGHWFQWNQMEGDWNVNGHTTGWHEYDPCSWPWACGIQSQTDWDYDVLPRHIEIWTYPYDNGYNHGANGSSTCGHLHVAGLWNN